MKHILVTGGAGYIGSHACKALARAGYRPVTYDNLCHGHRSAVQWGPLVEGDVGDRALLERTLRQYDIAAVMHFAAFAYVGESMHRPEIYFQNNVINSMTLLEAMRAALVSNIVFSSTCATYGTPNALPITEDTPQRPVNPYGETKLMVERALHWYGQAHGLKSVALRYFNASGADPEGEIGEDHDPETHLIPLILDAALGHRVAIDIYGTDYPTADGTAVRDYIHVQDLAEAHVGALRYLLEGGPIDRGPSLALNLGTGQGYSVRQVIAAAEQVTGRRVPRREMARRSGDPAVLVADPSRAAQLLGWRAVRSDLETILGTAWAWHTRHPQVALAVGD
jgi:UDP-glucose-4-epimerase GalE